MAALPKTKHQANQLIKVIFTLIALTKDLNRLEARTKYLTLMGLVALQIIKDLVLSACRMVPSGMHKLSNHNPNHSPEMGTTLMRRDTLLHHS